MENKNYRAALNLLIESFSSPANEKNPVAHHQLILELGLTTPLLRTHGMPDIPLAINGRVIDKCFFDHGIPRSMLERLYPLICSPKALYTPSNGKSGCVVMTVEVKNGNPIIVSIEPNRQMAGRRNFYNVVTSMYDKAGNAEARWTQQGLLLWKA